MKWLLDACVWVGAREARQAAGHNVVWVGEWPTDPGEEETLAQAQREGRILVTLDKDFGELTLVQGELHSRIPQLANLPARQQAPGCMEKTCSPARLSPQHQTGSGFGGRRRIGW